MKCPTTTAWSPAFLLSTSLVFCVDCPQPSLQWGNRKCRMFESAHSGSFFQYLPAHLFTLSPHVLFLCILSCLLHLTTAAQSILQHRSHELPCLKFWCVIGCFHHWQRQLHPAATSTGQFITLALRGQPCSLYLSKALQFLSIKIVAKKKKRKKVTIDILLMTDFFQALLNTLPWNQLQYQGSSHFKKTKWLVQTYRRRAVSFPQFPKNKLCFCFCNCQLQHNTGFLPNHLQCCESIISWYLLTNWLKEKKKKKTRWLPTS